MKCRSSSAQPSSPALSANALAPPSPHSEMWMWEPEPGDAGYHALQRGPRISGAGLPVGRLVGKAPGHLGRPRDLRERLGQRRDVDVAEAVLEARDDVVAQVDGRDRLAERQALRR